MKRNSISTTVSTLIRIVTVCFALASATLALAQSEPLADWQRHNACSDRGLFGHYGAKIEGTFLDFPGQPLLRSLVLFDFKGDGTMTSKAYAVLNGTPEQPDWPKGAGQPGTYEVNPDCTGFIDVVNPAIKMHFVALDNGEKVFLVFDGGAITGVAEKVH